ncbi:MAG TPA: hypothetical protein PLU64_15410, partial [Saprospiraceae bacterium]|nr:hypothetical protein [Saprospiraceae bacterium]
DATQQNDYRVEIKNIRQPELQPVARRLANNDGAGESRKHHHDTCAGHPQREFPGMDLISAKFFRHNRFHGYSYNLSAKKAINETGM